MEKALAAADHEEEDLDDHAVDQNDNWASGDDDGDKSRDKLWLSWAKLKLSLVRVVDEVIVILDFF